MRNAFAICLAVSAASLSLAGEPQPHHVASTNAIRITPALINQLAEEMRTNHPALRAADARAEAAEANAAAVRSWEDPTLRLGGVGAKRDFRASDGDLIYGIEQKLPVFGKPQLARRVAQADVATKVANTDYEFQVLRRELAKFAFLAALADQTAAVGEQDLVWLETMTRAMEEKYRSGQGQLIEVLQLQNERAKRVEQLKTDRQNLTHAQLTLNRLLNRELQSPWPKMELPSIADEVHYNPKLVNFALKYEPKLKVMREQIKQAEAMTQLSRRQRLPDVSLGFEGRNYTGDGSVRQDTVMLSFTLPWANRGKYRSEIRRDEARLKATEFDAADYSQVVREEVHMLTVKIDAFRREALLYRDQIIPRSEQALASAHALLEFGSGMMRDLLEARRMLLDSRLMFVRAVSEQYQMLSELVLCCGLGDLEALQMLSRQAQDPKTAEPQP